MNFTEGAFNDATMNIVVDGRKSGVLKPTENDMSIKDWVEMKGLVGNSVVLYMAMSAKWNGGGKRVPIVRVLSDCLCLS